MSYRVKTVSERTGIPRNTLVAWERRYQMLTPHRSESGYRIYTDEDVLYLQRLKTLVDGGLSISEAIAHGGAAPGHAGADGPPGPPATGLQAPSQSAAWSQQLAEHLIDFDRAHAAPLLRRIEQLPFEEAITRVWAPLLQEIGRAWADEEITVAQEHFVAAVAREHLLAMFRSLDAGLGSGPHVVCACLPEEQHDLPLLCVAVRLAIRGWRVTWLGADLPISDLSACCVQQKPELVCLSSVQPPSTRSVTEHARQVRASVPEATLVVVGGPGAAPLADRSTARLWFCADMEAMLERWATREVEWVA